MFVLSALYNSLYCVGFLNLLLHEYNTAMHLSEGIYTLCEHNMDLIQNVCLGHACDLYNYV